MRLACCLFVLTIHAILCAEVAGKTSKHAKKKKAKAANKHSYSETGGCAGRRGITHADVFGFFDEAASGRRTRAEVVAQADRVLADLELGCTPGLGDDPALYEKLQSLTWGFLHDGPRTLRGIELRAATLSAAKKPVGDRGSISSQLALLGERARILRAYGNRSASHYSHKWPPGSSDGHVAYPSKGCGGFPSSVRPASGRPVVEGDNGGWLGSKKARIRWGGGDSCSIRVLTATEWEKASPDCLAALFTRPFLVQGLDDTIVGAHRFRREELLSLGSQSTIKISSLGEVSANGSRQLPPIGNLSHWTTTGPAALRAARTVDEMKGSESGDDVTNSLETNQAQKHASYNAEVVGTGASEDASGLALSDTEETAMALVKEIGYLPGTLGEHIARMRRETEAPGTEAAAYVFGTELLEAHHAELLDGMAIPRQFDGFLNTQAPLLVNLALGGPGSGVYFHRHDAAFSEVFYGAKRWMFFPDFPTTEEAGETGADKEHYEWSAGPKGFLNPTLNSSKSFAEEKLELLREEFDIDVCTQHAGDLLYVPTAWHHATVNLGETVGLSWREQFLESAPSLEVAAAKWMTRQRRGGPVRPVSQMRSVGQRTEPDEDAGTTDGSVDRTTAGVVFDLWLSDDEVIQAQREAEGLRDLERRATAEAAMPTREEMIRNLEARQKSSRAARLESNIARGGQDGHV